MPKLVIDIGIGHADVGWRPSDGMSDGGEGWVKSDDVSRPLHMRCEVHCELYPMLWLAGEVRTEVCRLGGAVSARTKEVLAAHLSKSGR